MSQLFPTTHAGSTSPVPVGAIRHWQLEAQALQDFARYAKERPQVQFGALKIEVLQVGDDLIRNTERAIWRARSRIRRSWTGTALRSSSE